MIPLGATNGATVLACNRRDTLRLNLVVEGVLANALYLLEYLCDPHNVTGLCPRMAPSEDLDRSARFELQTWSRRCRSARSFHSPLRPYLGS
jgi:hypothetical protein